MLFDRSNVPGGLPAYVCPDARVAFVYSMSTVASFPPSPPLRTSYNLYHQCYFSKTPCSFPAVLQPTVSTHRAGCTLSDAE